MRLESQAMIEIKEDEYHLFKQYLLENCGIDIPEEKSYLFRTRLNDLFTEEKAKNFSELYYLIKQDESGRLRERLISHMTTNETSFFRDGHPFDAFYNAILPRVAERKIKEAKFFEPKIKIWSAGCSSGQEPYSIAMLISNWNHDTSGISLSNVHIMATDISCKVLEKAKKGFYKDKEMGKHFGDIQINKYFTREAGGWQAKKEIKDMISFQELNLSHNFEKELGKLDIIFCRNVVIYFSKKLIQDILNQFYLLLNPGGILILGASESLYNLATKFKMEQYGKTVFYIK